MYQGIYYDRPSNTMHVWDDERGYYNTQYKSYAYKVDIDGNKRTLYGDPCKRVNRWSQTDLKRGEIYESDLMPEVRFLIDTYLHSDDVSKNHRILFYDIEVAKEKGADGRYKYSTPKDADNTITSIAAYDNIDNVYNMWLLDPTGELEDRVTDEYNLYVIDNEANLLQAFIDYWIGLNPNIITGWNNDFFDNPYLINRIEKVLGSAYVYQLSPIGIVVNDPEKLTVEIAGITSFDYQYLYKKFSYSEEPRYSLDWISKKELKRGKIEYEGSLQKLYETDIEKFIQYNITDVELILALNEKLGYIDLALAQCHESHVPYKHIYFSSYCLDGAAITHCTRRGIVLPNRKFARNPDESKARGAFVKPPEKGLHQWIFDLDLKSLYPSIIRTLNISPETKMAKIYNWDEERYYLQNTADEWDLTWSFTSVRYRKEKINSIDLKELLEDRKMVIASNGVIYRTDEKGLLPTLLEGWDEGRTEAKDLMKKYKAEGNKEMTQFYNTRQLSKKVFSNSLYGVLLLLSSRYYDKDNGEAITTTGVSTIQITSKYSNKYYSDKTGRIDDYCIYTDTDSVFYSAIPILKAEDPNYDLNEDTFENASANVIRVAGELQKEINSMYDIYAKRFHNCDTHFLSIKQENVARRGIWIKKKRYAQHIINEEGVPVNYIDVKGLDSVRSNFPQAFRDVMNAIITGILHDKTMDEVTDILLNFKDELPAASFDDVTIPTSVKDITKYNPSTRDMFHFIKSTPAHVKAALAYNDFLKLHDMEGEKQIADGDKIVWAYLAENELGIVALALKNEDDPQVVYDYVYKHIDRDKIFNKILVKKIQDFYDHIGWGDIIINSEVTKFFKF